MCLHVGTSVSAKAQDKLAQAAGNWTVGLLQGQYALLAVSHLSGPQE